MKIAKAAVVAVALMSGACSNISNEDAGAWTGAVIGGLAGGWAGAQFGGGTGQMVFTVLGALSGGMTGYETGRSLMVADRQSYDRAVAEALDAQHGSTQASWENPETGNSGLIRMGQSFSNANGEDCRQFRSTVAFSDAVLSGPGAACRAQGGQWTLVADAFQ